MNGCRRSRVTSTPCAAPRAAPVTSAAMSATAGGQCHSTSIIDSSTPSSAHMEPTDRSMPPVMMTRPTPMLKMPYVPTSRLTFCRLSRLRNCGLASATSAQSTVSSSATARSFLVMVPARQRCSGYGQLHDRLRRALKAVQHAGDTTIVHDGHAIALGHDFLHVAADQHHCRAVVGEPADQPVDFCLRANVHPLRRLIEHDGARPQGEPFAEHDLLLVAAAQCADRRFDRWRLH